MQAKTILVTSASGLVGPSIIAALRQSDRFRFTIVAVDSSKEQMLAANFGDRHYIVPWGNDVPNYIDRMMEICDSESVDLILPVSDEEVLSLSLFRQHFEEKGIFILCTGYESARVGFDKALALQRLESANIPVPNYRIPRSLKEFQSAVAELGFPQKMVVLKPIASRGSRGVRILKNDFDEWDHLISEKAEWYINHERIIKLLTDRPVFPDIVLMEYLPGKQFSIDIFANQGQAVCVIPHRRVVGITTPILYVAVMEQDLRVRAMVERIVSEMNFDNLVNMEIGYSEKNEPLLIEMNPRASSTLAHNRVTGADILDMAVRHALGEEIIPPVSYRCTRYASYFQTIYEKAGPDQPV